MPFVDITVTDAWYCDQTTQMEVYTRPWYGLDLACDCTRKCDTDSEGNDADWCYTMVLDQECDKQMKKNKCKQVEPWPLIWQSQFLGKRICGTLGGDPFANVTRPDAATLECPSGTSPCLTTTVANETLCYPPDQL